MPTTSRRAPAAARPAWAAPHGLFPRSDAPGLPPGSEAVYRRRRPTATPLYPLVQQHLETFLARTAEADPLGEGVAGWVEEDFRAYLRCGILAHGFARLRCDGCATERLVAFSCKGRGVCPSCNTRRMVQVAAHLTDHVLPPLPVRQWVLSVPKRIRPFLPHDAALAGAVLGVLLRAIRGTLQRTSPGAPRDASLGAVSFLHRFGSGLNPHFHFHLVVLDGVFSEQPDGGVRFHEATHLSPDDAACLAHTVQRRVLRL
ncbi:MAG TPA: transposase zinc-binding domain-containing protein, partial [Longimicrobiales bacterium]|nr:transposase zinc-binding domain-containing protein [Longimicrobiales bacterium]